MPVGCGDPAHPDHRRTTDRSTGTAGGGSGVAHTRHRVGFQYQRRLPCHVVARQARRPHREREGRGMTETKTPVEVAAEALLARYPDHCEFGWDSDALAVFGSVEVGGLAEVV